MSELTVPHLLHPSAAQTPRRWEHARRRLVTIPAVFLGTVLWLAASPVWLIAAGVADRLSRRGSTFARAGLLVAWLLLCEVWGITTAGVWWGIRRLGGVDADRYLAWHRRLEVAWITTVWRGAAWLFRMRIRAAGLEAATEPAIVFVRHASIADTLLPGLVVQRPFGLQMRYVLKHELHSDPCIDVIGHRLPNAFVQRRGADTAGAVAAITGLAHEMGPREGIVLYPEGTRYSAGRRERLLARLEARRERERLAYARSLRHVLPPRLGGVEALLGANPGLDAVFLAHAGLEGVTRLRDLCNGTLLDVVVEVYLWRVPYDAIPAHREGRRRWVEDQWRRMDAVVGLLKRHEGPDPGAGAPVDVTAGDGPAPAPGRRAAG
ncbi:MAG: 1-acyl-sn-glycerol-3-phosphate acyltransferase [Myxococcota bacterium]